MKLADAFINIVGDDSKLGGVFQSAQQKTSGFVGGMASQIATLGSAAILAGATALAAGVVGIGVAAFSASSQLNDASNNMQTQLGITEERATELGEVVKSVYGNNFGDSIADAANAVGLVNQQLNQTGQLSDSEIGRATENAFALRDAYGIDVQESLLAAQNLMEKFGLTSDEAFGFITGGMQQGLNASGDFLESINEYSVQFADGGADAGQFFAIMETGLQAGMLGTDKAADLFKEFRVRIQDGSDGVSEALEMIGLDSAAMAEQMADGSLSAIDAFDMVKGALAGVEDENLQFQAGVALMGSQFEDLGTSAVLGLEFIDTALEDVMGSTDSLNKQYDNWPSMWEGIKRQGQLALVPLGNVLLDIGQRIMPLVNQAFGWFQTNIIPIIETVAEKAKLFLDTLFGGLQSGLTPLEAFKAALASVIPPELMAQIEPVIDAVARFIGQVVAFVGTHSDELKAALLAIGAVLAAAGIVSAILGIVAAIGAILSPVGLVVAAIAILAAAWEGNWGGIQEKTQAALDFIQNLIETVLTAIQGFWDKHGETILTTAETVWEGIKTAIDTVLQVIDSIWQAFKAAFEGDWTGFGENLRAAWDTAWEAIKTALSTAGTALLGAVSTLILGLIAKFQDTDWGQLGRNIITGLVNGLNSAKDAVIQAIVNIASAAEDAIKAFFGISSPSKMFMEIGHDLNAGLAIGLGEIDPVLGAVDGLGQAVVTPFDLAGVGAAADGGGNSISITLDLRGAVVASQRQLEDWIQGALNRTGRRADQMRRTG